MEKAALQTKKRTLKIISVLATNFISSVGIIVSNKYIFKYFKIHPIRLVAFHQMATTFLSILGNCCGLYSIKPINIYKVLPLSIFFTLFIVFSNLSLMTNTVGTYQLLKCLSDPCILLFERYIFKTTYSTKVQLSFLPMVLGVFINSFYDIDFKLVGLVHGFIGIVCCAVYGILVGRKQKELEINSLQLLYYQAPLSTIFLSLTLIVGNKYQFIQEDLEFFSNLSASSSAQNNIDLPFISFLAIFTALSAYLVNFSTFWIIGNTSIVSYAVFSKLKLCAILISGVVFFDEMMNFKQGLGIVLTLGGVFYYTFLKVQERKEGLPK